MPCQVVDKVFPKVLEAIEADSSRAVKKKRLEVLKFKNEDCRMPQLNPVFNNYEICHEEVSSCRVDPEVKARLKGKRGTNSPTHDKSSLPAGIKFLKTIKVDKDASYEVIHKPGLITLVQFDNAEEI